MIHEIENVGDRFSSSLQQWQKGGLIIFPSLGMGINAVDITNILNEEKYQNFIDSSLPSLFIKEGTWYNIKERKTPVRYEKWRELELAEKRKVLLPVEKDDISQEKVNFLLKKYKPDFLKQSSIK